ncbi:hypothetical protein EYC84_000252 [Monilinia fructicola]|uniref:10 kDa heat shock protein, mitochondrial n=1 Tax=Monilinia fructicola TaxID=38448 RepID=A0A5M9JST8_MONFR|nr:hypothetical protein EYC84_000252 [Monilinia fructicola]
MSTALKSIKSLAPLLDRVLVQRIKAETKTASGIFLPESSVKELNEARVLAVGPGGLDKDGKRVSCSVQAGDRVLIPQYGGSPVKVGEEEYSLFRDHDILAKINDGQSKKISSERFWGEVLKNLPNTLKFKGQTFVYALIYAGGLPCMN